MFPLASTREILKVSGKHESLFHFGPVINCSSKIHYPEVNKYQPCSQSGCHDNIVILTSKGIKFSKQEKLRYLINYLFFLTDNTMLLLLYCAVYDTIM